MNFTKERDKVFPKSEKVSREKAHPCYFGKGAFSRLQGDNKELLFIPNAAHTDLYDNLEVFPFGKLCNL